MKKEMGDRPIEFHFTGKRLYLQRYLEHVGLCIQNVVGMQKFCSVVKKAWLRALESNDD